MTHRFVSSGSEASEDEEWTEQDERGSTRIKPSRGASTRGRLNRRSSSRRSATSNSKHHIKHFVEHNYHDHSHDPVQSGPDGGDPVYQWMNEEEDDSKRHRRATGHRGGVAVPFPEKLHYMLSQMERNGTDDIVNWQPHGRCFVVHKPKEFVEEIMPK